jgi:hypothetical protein
MRLDHVAQALERAFSIYDEYIERGSSRSSAATLTASAIRVERHKLVALLNDRDAGIIGGSGSQITRCVVDARAAA